MQHTPAMPLHFIELTTTQQEAQELLEFYLRQPMEGARTGAVVPVSLEDALASLLSIQLALPSECSSALRKILQPLRIDSYIKGYIKRPWANIKLGRKHYGLFAVTDDENDRQGLRSLISRLRNQR